MAAIVVIGDELTCAGFRLAGLATCCPPRAELHAEFARALETAPMVVLSRGCADALAPDVLRQAMARESPLLVVLPDITDPRPDVTFTRRMRAVLGIET